MNLPKIGIGTAANESAKFFVGLNRSVVGKCDPQKLSYSGAFKQAQVTMQGLAEHISKGYPWMPALLNGNKRRQQANANYTDTVAIDIDGGLTIEQALADPFIQSHAGLLIESSSSKPEHHKFRIVFRLQQPIEGWENIRLAFKYLINLFGASDPACKDASRFFFGGLDREARLLNESARLPENFFADAQKWQAAEDADYKKEALARAEKSAAWIEQNGSQPIEEAAEALKFISSYQPGEGRYSSLVAMIGGVVNEFGTAGEHLLKGWGEAGKWGKSWDKQLQSIARSRPARPATIATLFHLAKEGGYRPAKRKSAKVGSAAPAPARQRKTDEAGGAQKLSKKLQAELEKWLAVAREVAPNFAETDDAFTDIERAKAVILAATARKVAYDRSIQNTGEKFTADVFESLLSESAPVFVGGETGGGKTELATQLTAHALGKNSGLQYAAIAPTQVLSVQTAERFESKGVPMESTAAIAGKHSSREKPKALPAESLWKMKGKALDLLACDEPDQWVQRILGGILGDAADVNLDVLKSLVQSVPHQFWLNADPNPITVSLLESLSGQRPIMVDLQRQQAKKSVNIDFYHDGVTESGNISGGSGRLYGDFIEAARSGDRVLLLAGSVKKARAVKKRLQSFGIAALLKDGRYTPKNQRLGFALAPEKAMQGHDVVILTRLVETGLDLQKDFDTVFVAVSPKMPARSVYQFLSRSRSLLRGDTGKLCIYNPSRNFTSIEQLSASYWADKIRSENKLYLSLLRGDTAGVKSKLEAINWAIDYKARYRADEARQSYFREDLLLRKFAELGWDIERDIFPNIEDCVAIDRILQRHIYQAGISEAHCTARGHRHISDYSEQYAAKLSDPNEQGLILECKRRKLELSALLPDSDLENVDLIFRLQEDERILPQTLLRSAIALNPSSDRVQQLIEFLSSAHLDKMTLYGPLQGLKELKKSKTVLTLAIAEIIGSSTLVKRVLAGDDEISYADSDVQEFAALLSTHSELVNAWCRRYYGRSFAWDEDATSVVCKALDKLLGIKSATTGQKSVKAASKKTHRPRVMRTDLSEAGRQALAKIQAKKIGVDPSELIGKIEADSCQRHCLADSAVSGWEHRILNAISLINQAFDELHTKNKIEKTGSYFSVQADVGHTALPPPIPPAKQLDVAPLATKATETADPFDDSYYNQAAWEARA